MKLNLSFNNWKFIVFNLILVYPTLMFGRSFMGLKIVDFRIGEILVATSLLLSLIILFQKQFFEDYFDLKVQVSYVILILIVISSFIFLVSDFKSTYIFKSSSYIWLISFIFFSKYFFESLNITIGYLISLNILLFSTYFLSVIYFPNFLKNFFLDYSDKFDYLKASEILLILIFVIFLNNRFLNKFTLFNFEISFLIISLFLPLIIFKSRGSSLGLILFIVLEIYTLRKKIKFSIIKSIFLIFFCFVTFYISASLVTDVKPDASESIISDEIVEGLLDNKNTSINNLFSFYVLENIDDLKTFGFLNNGRVFSTDGNINWRLQIWQDVILDSLEESAFIFGHGYENKIPTMNNPLYTGTDGSNEYVHNYIVNIFARGGLVQLIILYYFYFQILKISIYNLKSFDIINYFLPVLVVSLFDSSMSSPHFPFLFYLFFGQILIIMKKD